MLFDLDTFSNLRCISTSSKRKVLLITNPIRVKVGEESKFIHTAATEGFDVYAVFTVNVPLMRMVLRYIIIYVYKIEVSSIDYVYLRDWNLSYFNCSILYYICLLG